MPLLWSALLSGFLVQACAQVPAPLLELRFEVGLANSGSEGGNAAFQDYVPGEEAMLADGPWGSCLDTTNASRHGGATPEDPKAGSAVVFSSPALTSLSSYTLAGWYREAPQVTGSLARLVYWPEMGDLTFGRGRLGLGIADLAGKKSYDLTGLPGVEPGAWTFFALVVDGDKLTAVAYSGSFTTPLAASRQVTLSGPPVPTEAPLTVANLGGIRPFKGWFDNLRLWGTPLTQEQIREVFAADRASSQTPGTASLLPVVARDPTGPGSLFRHSDICFSTRWQKDTALPVMRDFHTTRSLWTYGNAKTFVDAVGALGISYQGTLNGMQGCEQGQPEADHTSDTTGRAFDFDGLKYVAPWMRGWTAKVPRYIGCCNHPDFQRIFLAAADELIDAGVRSIQVDDWSMNASWCRSAGVCFCEHCMKGFREYLVSHLTTEQLRELGVTDPATFDYHTYLRTHDGITSAEAYRAAFRRLPLSTHFLAFQTESVRRFYREVQGHVDARAGSHVTISVNNQFGDRGPDGFFNHTYCADLHDFQVGEKYNASLPTHVLAAKLAEGMGRWQVLSPIPHNLGEARAALATTYAMGQLYLVPWDIYMGTEPNGPPKPRYFATREQYGDCYDLIHEHPELFDGYEAPGTVLVFVNLDLPEYEQTLSLCERLTRASVPYRLAVCGSRYARFPLVASELSAARAIVTLSPLESLSDTDRQALETALSSRRVRLLTDTPDLETRLTQYGLVPLTVEGPHNALAVLRRNPATPEVAVVHLLNWELTPDLSGVETFEHVTISLQEGAFGAQIAGAEYYEPGQTQAQTLTVERHSGYVRITVPALRTWGIVKLTLKGKET
jgi:hypothetical protein